MNTNLNNMKIAILVSDGFEEAEMVEPKKALEKAQAKVYIVSPTKGKVKSWKYNNWGNMFNVDIELAKANANDFAALILPGGVMNPDQLRITPEAIQFIQKFIKGNKPIATICHGPWILIDADGVKGKTLTSYPSLKTDLINAGAHWISKEVVRDGMLITSRKPADLEAFIAEILSLLFEVKQKKVA